NFLKHTFLKQLYLSKKLHNSRNLLVQIQYLYTTLHLLFLLQYKKDQIFLASTIFLTFLSLYLIIYLIVLDLCVISYYFSFSSTNIEALNILNCFINSEIEPSKLLDLKSLIICMWSRFPTVNTNTT